MSATQKPAPKTRRQFFHVAGQGAGAAAASVATVVAGAPAAAATEVETAETGYRETAHVKRYYQLAAY